MAARIRSGRWQAVGCRVVVLHTGRLTRRQQMWVGVLHAGPGSCLGGSTAAEADGFEGFPSLPVHVVVRRGRRVPPLEHPQVRLVVHESRRLQPGDVHPARSPARTRLPRPIVDAAAWAGADDAARAILAAAVQQRLVRVAELKAVLAGGGALRRRRLLLETLDDVEGGSHSLPELQWLDLLRRRNLPLPTCQRKVRRPNGTYYLDAD
ncbi:MAG: hypothetical protein M3P96_10705 [Actinomycetota bacterium]|nr:hypothetical protein [Actinomycetota bacterium]